MNQKALILLSYFYAKCLSRKVGRSRFSPAATASATATVRSAAGQAACRTRKTSCNARCSCERCERCVMREPRSLPLTPMAKPMNRFAASGDPRAEGGPKDRKDDQGRNGRVVQIGPEGLAP